MPYSDEATRERVIEKVQASFNELSYEKKREALFDLVKQNLITVENATSLINGTPIRNLHLDDLAIDILRRIVLINGGNAYISPQPFGGRRKTRRSRTQRKRKTRGRRHQRRH